MSKTKVTRKYIKEVYGTPIELPYSHTLRLLEDIAPDFYCTRVEGWACDVYYLVEIDKVITVGYAPFGHAIKSESYKTLEFFDNEAKELTENYRLAYSNLLDKYNGNNFDIDSFEFEKMQLDRLYKENKRKILIDAVNAIELK